MGAIDAGALSFGDFLAELQRQCATLERECTVAGVAAELLAGERPGAGENPDPGPFGWLRYFKFLHRTHATAGRAASPAGELSAALVDDVLAASLADEPIVVTCSDGERRPVYPKSYHALRWLDALDASLRLNAQCALACAELADGHELKVAAMAPLVESLAVRLWLWVLTHPEPGLPFDEGDRDPQPPAWTGQVTPEDLVAFQHAHVEVHRVRLAILGQALPPDPAAGTSRLSLAGFVGAAANEVNAPRREVMRQWSLGSLFASAVASARASKEARDRADARREAEAS